MAKPKALTRAQLQARKDKAARFLRDVVGDPDRAAEVEDESLEDYAERRKIQILNPRRSNMARQVKTAAEYRQEIAALKAEISELEETNAELEDQLDEIADIVSGEEEEEEEEEEDDKGNDDQD